MSRRITRTACYLTVAGACVLALAVSPPMASVAADPSPTVPASDNSAHGGGTLDDTHNIPTNAVSGDVSFVDNVRGVSGYSSLNFIISYPKYGYDYMFANGTGGLAVWSLKDPEARRLQRRRAGQARAAAAVHGDVDQNRFHHDGRPRQVRNRGRRLPVPPRRTRHRHRAGQHPDLPVRGARRRRLRRPVGDRAGRRQLDGAVGRRSGRPGADAATNRDAGRAGFKTDVLADKGMDKVQAEAAKCPAAYSILGGPPTIVGAYKTNSRPFQLGE
jgi:hypothetical protein